MLIQVSMRVICNTIHLHSKVLCLCCADIYFEHTYLAFKICLPIGYVPPSFDFEVLSMKALQNLLRYTNCGLYTQ